jgi:hypothetical protein
MRKTIFPDEAFYNLSVVVVVFSITSVAWITSGTAV